MNLALAGCTEGLWCELLFEQWPDTRLLTTLECNWNLLKGNVDLKPNCQARWLSLKVLLQGRKHVGGRSILYELTSMILLKLCSHVRWRKLAMMFSLFSVKIPKWKICGNMC